MGVIEVHNKEPSDEAFSKRDEEVVVPFGNVIGIALNAHDNFKVLAKHKMKMAYTDCLLLRRAKVSH